MHRSLLLHNGRFWTGEAAGAASFLSPTSILIEGGRIVAIDPPAVPAGALVIDACGRTIVPGFIDSHMHLVTGGLGLGDLDLRAAESRHDFERLIAEQHERLPPDQWLIARNWSAASGSDAMPDKSWLAAAGERPVVCYRMDLHAAIVNDAVLRLCDLSAEPPGGRIARDERGEPTGLMIEAALWKLVNPIVPEPTANAKMQAVLKAQDHCHALGITAVGAMEYARDVREVLLTLAQKLTLRCAVTLLDRGWPMDFSIARAIADACRGNVRVIGCKAFADGTFGLRTARMLESYADDPGNRGMLVEFAAEGHLREWARAVAGAWLSPSIHAIGDEAVRLALDACETLPVNIKARIEHAQQIHEDDVRRFGTLPVVASMQPMHKADDGRYARSRLGEQRLRGFFPFRQLLEAGAVLAFGSDWPVVTCDPIAGIRAAVTGLTLDGKPVRPQEKLSVEEALRAYTVDAAQALGMNDAGLIRAAAAGDVVMLDIDPFTADWNARPPRVVLTIARGRIVHDAPRTPALSPI